MDTQTLPTLKDQATAMLQSLIAAATQAGDFIKEQIPLVIQELLRFNLLYNIVWLVLGVLFMAAGIFIVRKLWPWAKKHEDDSEGFSYAAAIAPALTLSVAGLWVILDHIRPTMMLALAPRVWLIEYAASLVK